MSEYRTFSRACIAVYICISFFYLFAAVVMRLLYLSGKSVPVQVERKLRIYTRRIKSADTTDKSADSRSKWHDSLLTASSLNSTRTDSVLLCRDDFTVRFIARSYCRCVLSLFFRFPPFRGEITRSRRVCDSFHESATARCCAHIEKPLIQSNQILVWTLDKHIFQIYRSDFWLARRGNTTTETNFWLKCLLDATRRSRGNSIVFVARQSTILLDQPIKISSPNTQTSDSVWSSWMHQAYP